MDLHRGRTFPGRIVDVLGALHAQLESQQKAGSRFFIGSSLTALDLHWAAFSHMVAPGGPETWLTLANIFVFWTRAPGLRLAPGRGLSQQPGTFRPVERASGMPGSLSTGSNVPPC